MIDIDELDDEHEQRNDFRRANGAPLVSDPENLDKSQRYSRPSSYAKILDDEEALHQWRIWKAMEGVASSKALATQVAATKEDDRDAKRALREKALDKGQANERADHGTALHAMLARVEDLKDDFEIPPDYEGDVKAYLECMARYGLEAALIECHMVNDDFRAAGTADRIYRLTKALTAPDGQVLQPGELVLGDLKTGQKLDFSLPGYSVQMALYATAKLYDIHSERRLVTPEIHEGWTLLVHAPVGKSVCKLLWCSIEVGLYGAWLAQETKKWRANWKSGREFYDELPVPEPAQTTAELVEETFPGTSDVTVPADIAPAVLAWCRQRITAIGTNDEARKWLVLKWPKSLPKPAAIEAPGDLVRLLDLLDQIETQFSLPFVGNDPRRSTGHKSQTDRSNGRGLTA